jgi:RNA polymerase sigma-70 factor (ECF subfamily)
MEEVETRLPGPPSPLGGFGPHELKHLIRQGLATLSDAQKQVIELVSYDGLSMHEIANKTGDTLVNVRHHYYRGLQNLRSFIGHTREKSKAAGD